MNRKKVAFKTFGCKLNFSETSAISREFKHNGFDVVDFRDMADIYVINSCTVTANAEKKCKVAIRQSNRRNPDAKIAVIGCLSQLIPDELKKIHQVDFVLGSNEKFNLLD
ncbi:MAG: tRNA (N(6)-L-threonylcarbamoyladenosine(37)-C(2))-methylthiotransferase MtaB, partial [Bacteroidales bacterium]|nr:tRNA (N(6)-L-threonylcarbamoyladenosine(37)-C(2))-methylthiotransferase MtaB [Bacteroidales bacterium]